MEFHAVDEAAPVEEPVVVESGDVFLAAAPECGEVTSTLGDVYLVQTNFWELPCEEARHVAEVFAAGDGDYPLGSSGTRLQTAIVDDWACEQSSPQQWDGDQFLGRVGPFLHTCSPWTAAQDDPSLYDIDYGRKAITFTPVDGWPWETDPDSWAGPSD